MTADAGPKAQSRYHALIERVFSRIHTPGTDSLEFAREDLSAAAQQLGMELPKNLGDVVLIGTGGSSYCRFRPRAAATNYR